MALLAEVLRILTPEEISELTTSSSGTERLELTSMLECVEEGETFDFREEAEDQGAKILPFSKKIEEVEEEEKEYVVAGEQVIEYINHYLEKMTLGETSVSVSGDTVETSVFILKEKKRFEYVHAKMKSKEVMNLYIKNAGVDIEQEKTLKDDLSKSSRSGVLVNKKQF